MLPKQLTPSLLLHPWDRRPASELLSLIRISFGGMVAEEISFGESGTGPSADLADATRMAAQMVGALGMGGSLLSLEAAHGQPGQDLVAKVLDDDRSRAAAEKILDDAKAEAERLLIRHRPIHTALRDALLDRGELVGDEILDVIRDAILRDQLTEIDLREQPVDGRSGNG